jgi:hypothetical protein
MADKKQNWFKRHKVWTTVIGIFLLFSIIGAIGSNSSTPTTASTKSSGGAAQSSSTASTMPTLNQPANDGKFSFTVTSFKCGETQITQPDDSYQTSQAQGQFCVMDLTVKNIGSVAQDFDPSSQYIYDNANKQYSSSSDATITANPTSSDFSVLDTVNPGVSVSGIVVFDIPAGTSPTYVMLHDSGASNGVKVSLTQ